MYYKKNAENEFLALPQKLDFKMGGAPSVSEIITVYDNISNTTKKPRELEIKEIFKQALIDEQENQKQ